MRSSVYIRTNIPGTVTILLALWKLRQCAEMALSMKTVFALLLVTVFCLSDAAPSGENGLQEQAPSSHEMSVYCKAGDLYIFVKFLKEGVTKYCEHSEDDDCIKNAVKGIKSAMKACFKDDTDKKGKCVVDALNKEHTIIEEKEKKNVTDFFAGLSKQIEHFCDSNDAYSSEEDDIDARGADDSVTCRSAAIKAITDLEKDCQEGEDTCEYEFDTMKKLVKVLKKPVDTKRRKLAYLLSKLLDIERK